MKIKPLVSIIIPVYNTENFIIRCLESVMKQDFAQLEIIIINDCSTDTSHDIILKYLSTFKNRLIVYNTNKTNLGLSRTRNKGIKVSNGEYIYFLDSDDELIDEFVISKMYRKILTIDAEVCIAETKQIRKKEHFYNTYHKIKTKNDFLDNNIIENYLRGEWAAIACNRLYNKKFIIEKKILFFPNIIHEDELWSFNVFLLTKKIVFLKEYTYLYYIGENKESITQRKIIDIKSLEVILFGKLDLLKKNNILYYKKPYLDIIKNDINILLEKNNFNFFSWCKYYSRLNKKLLKFNIRFFLPSLLAYFFYIFNIKKVYIKNIRF